MDRHDAWLKGMAAFRAGDEEEFASLVRLYSPRLHRYCRKFARDFDDERDLVQATWVLAWERRSDFRGTGSFSAWLTRLARTICLRQASARAAAKEVSLDRTVEIPVRDGDEEEARAIQELEDDQLSAILALPTRRKQVVLLRLLAGLSTDETAHVLQCRPGTVKALLHQALLTLRIAGGLISRRAGICEIPTRVTP